MLYCNSDRSKNLFNKSLQNTLPKYLEKQSYTISTPNRIELSTTRYQFIMLHNKWLDADVLAPTSPPKNPEIKIRRNLTDDNR